VAAAAEVKAATEGVTDLDRDLTETIDNGDMDGDATRLPVIQNTTATAFQSNVQQGSCSNVPLQYYSL